MPIETHKDVSGVRIIPPVLQFKESVTGKVHQLSISVLNISKVSRSIRYYGPNQKIFEIEVDNPQKPVAPGLDVKATVLYCPPAEQVDSDRLVVTVDGDVIEVPIFGYPSLPALSSQNLVDFGNVVNNGKIVVQHIYVRNEGTKVGEFCIEYNGDKPITFVPNRGKVPARTELPIRVEYVAKHATKIDEVASVFLELQDPFDLNVKGEVVEGRVELLDYSTQSSIDCVRFGHAYYGTDCTQPTVLFNNSPEPIAFVVVLDEDSVGQESGKDLVANAGNTRLKAELGGEMNDLTSLVTTFPNWGTLQPYERLPMFFRFSPRWNLAKQGFITTKKSPPKQDFSLFMKIQVIGASGGFDEMNIRNKVALGGKQSKEIAITGSALPVQINVSPKNEFDFGKILNGQKREISAKVTNKSPTLPVNFQFRRVAHFVVDPNSAIIKPGETMDTVYKFEPKQIGSFEVIQYVDVLGLVSDNRNAFKMMQKVIESVPIYFRGICESTTNKIHPKYNPGITPKLTHEVGLNSETALNEIRTGPRAAVLKSAPPGPISEKALVAFPNDRAASLRPTERKNTYHTVFKGRERYNYVDPDYAFADNEAEAIEQHKQHYKNLIDEHRKHRFNKIMTKDYLKYNNPIDNHLEPAIGLKPKKLKITDVKPDPRPPTPPNTHWKLLSSKDLAKLQQKSGKNIVDGLNAIPTTSKEKVECSQILSPAELHQIVIGPPEVNFGDVCMKSQSQMEVNIINNLEQFVHISFNLDCQELQQSSPLSQVIPPRSKAILPLVLECQHDGKFQRSIEYTVNRCYKSHITVFANVVPVALELSTDHLIVNPTPGLSPDAGFREVITLINRLNQTAEFTWNPVLKGKGTAFSIRPAIGTVPPKSNLDCEIVFHPSYLAPLDAEFSLLVHGGISSTFTCQAKLGQAHVQFVDRRLQFGALPINLSTTKTALLQNLGQYHAFFEVLKPNPLPGITVSPQIGVVPVGGYTELDINVCSAVAMKFDDKVEVAIRGVKPIDVRIGGYIESPQINVNLTRFQFGGVYCGSKYAREFLITNKGKSRAQLQFDLVKYKDFSLVFPDHTSPEDVTFALNEPGKFSLTLEMGEEATGQLIFQPTEVASYDFLLNVYANDCEMTPPLPTPLPEPLDEKMSSSSMQRYRRNQNEIVVTPSRKVTATALRQPLLLSTNIVEFTVTPTYHEMSQSTGICKNSGTMFKNETDKRLRWCVDTSKGNKTLERGIFKFIHESGMPYMSQTGEGGVEGYLDPGETHALGVVFCPDKPGHFEVMVPLLLNDDHEKPYQWIQLIGELKAPRMWFDPPSIVLTPLPLDMSVTSEFTVIAAHYKVANEARVQMPIVHCDDGSEAKPLKIEILEGNRIEACSGEDGQPDSVSLPCKLTFQCSKPVSFCSPIIFIDGYGNKFELPVTATADNCLLSNYPYLAQHRLDHQIVCMKGHRLRGQQTIISSATSSSLGEAVLVAVGEEGRSGSRPSTTATSNSNFEVSHSSYESSETNSSPTESSVSSVREGALNKAASRPPADVSCVSEAEKRAAQQSRSLGSAVFPDENTEEGYFHTEVLTAVQRWFSTQGWPNGPYPINVPFTLRDSLSRRPRDPLPMHMAGKIETCGKSAAKQHGSTNKKEMATIYDMISYLAGRQLPGIATNSSLPEDPVERAKQVHWQHSSLLTFAKEQGAKVAAIKPEYLMSPRDYRVWEALQQRVEAIVRKSEGEWPLKPPGKNSRTLEEDAMEEQIFEAVSKRAWVDILLQLLKCLVLAKVTPKSLKKQAQLSNIDQLPNLDANPNCSNIYNLSERTLLLWLNHHYEQQREKIWSNAPKGGVPPARWIVNFDLDLLDGLVLGAVIATYAPWTVDLYMKEMYTKPGTAEQCLHNALRLVHAIRSIGIDYDIHAIDITDPNPVMMLLLVINLYTSLPTYVARSTITLCATLGKPMLKQIKVSNPSNKQLVYNAILAGSNARDFSLMKGHHVSISPKSSTSLNIQLTASHIRSGSAVLILAPKRAAPLFGSTLVFELKSDIECAPPRNIIKAATPCYVMARIPVIVKNIFDRKATFNVVLVQNCYLTGTKEEVAGRKVKEMIDALIDDGTSPKTMSAPFVEGVRMIDKRAFHCDITTVELDPMSEESITVKFLPIQPGKYCCSLVISDKQVGDSVFEVSAIAELPKPSETISDDAEKDKGSIELRSNENSVTWEGNRDKENTVFWQCVVGNQLKQKVFLSLSNSSRERALQIRKQQNMSDKELSRRRAAGTLTSSAIDGDLKKGDAAEHSTKREKIIFKCECDSLDFTVPSKVIVLQKDQHMPARKDKEAAYVHLDTHGLFSVPVKFQTEEAGHYSTNIKLRRGEDDIRVVKVECTAVVSDSETSIEFDGPVNEAIIQKIPVSNMTSSDWRMNATIEGDGWSGPPQLLVPVGSTVNYPLTFRPQFEGQVEGRLILETEHVEQKFSLIGKGQKSLPLDVIKLTVEAKQPLTYYVDVPNKTKRKLDFSVQCDVEGVSGSSCLVVLPGQTERYEMNAMPLKRGNYKGVLSFIATSSPIKDVDSDDEEEKEIKAADQKCYRVWFVLQLDVLPPPFEDKLSIKCVCQKKSVVEVLVSNPLEIPIKLEAAVQGSGLSGPKYILLPPASKATYELLYFPASVGKFEGELVFYHQSVGEFWYCLELESEPLEPQQLDVLECELGAWTKTSIMLDNPTSETLILEPCISNPNNYVLDISKVPLIIGPRSNTEVPVIFMPSSLGSEQHCCKISFRCPQLGEWVFLVSGIGLLPKPKDPICVTSQLGHNQSVIIPFRNSLDVAVIIDVIIRDKDEAAVQGVQDDEGLAPGPPSPFTVLLKENSGIRLAPRATLDIPVIYTPDIMISSQAMVTISVRKESGESWKFKSMEVTDKNAGYAAHLKRSESGSLRELQWTYPVHGFPEARSQPNTPPALIQCQSRCACEERLELKLAGVVPGAEGPAAQVRSITPIKSASASSSSLTGVVLTKSLAVAEEFDHTLDYPNSDAKQDCEQSVRLRLVRKERDQSTGLVILCFNVLFTPSKPMNHEITLVVQAATGGIWKFALKILASEPEPDDVIEMETAGLGTKSGVIIKLTSQEDQSAAFHAFFAEDSDPAFSVYPTSGELPPSDSNGLPLHICFQPTIYGKNYGGKLIVQTSKIQWSYYVVGKLPSYEPPTGQATRPIAGPHLDPRKRSCPVNLVRRNMKLTTTSPSSPIKGSKLIPRLGAN